LGTMEFGRAADLEKATAMMTSFLGASHTLVDTALMYAGGETERIIGRMPATLTKTAVIATKANPWNPKAPIKGLSRASVGLQLGMSLTSLGAESVDLFYLHAPDHNTPIEQTLQGVDDQFKAGKFKRFGLSNYSAWQVAEIVYLCKINGWVQPTVYQGMYNLMTRDVERELFTCLRRFNIAFYAYNPLAGGLLTGKYKFSDVDDKKPEGRFFAAAGADPTWSDRYRERYWKKSNFDALETLEAILREEYGTGATAVTPADAALRWMIYHSKLSGRHGDAVIIGASSPTHLNANLGAWSSERGPLSKKVVDAMDAVWELTKGQCANYFR